MADAGNSGVHRQDGLEVILSERGSRYGDFTDNALVAQELKEAMRRGKSWGRMTPYLMEALDQIASKISRIVTGDPFYQDNFADIQGYAKIVQDRLASGKGT